MVVRIVLAAIELAGTLVCMYWLLNQRRGPLHAGELLAIVAVCAMGFAVIGVTLNGAGPVIAVRTTAAFAVVFALVGAAEYPLPPTAHSIGTQLFLVAMASLVAAAGALIARKPKVAIDLLGWTAVITGGFAFLVGYVATTPQTGGTSKFGLPVFLLLVAACLTTAWLGRRLRGG